MSRIIKFRVWDKVQKTFTKDYGLVPWLETFTIVRRSRYYDEFYPDFSKKKKELVFQQYTGHKDKNGKEIYEGDLVKTRVDHHEAILAKIFNEEWPNYDRGEVRFVNSRWQVCQTGLGATGFNKYTCCEGEEHSAALEVIGNIYETTTI